LSQFFSVIDGVFGGKHAAGEGLACENSLFRKQAVFLGATSFAYRIKRRYATKVAISQGSVRFYAKFVSLQAATFVVMQCSCARFFGVFDEKKVLYWFKGFLRVLENANRRGSV